MIPFPKKKYKVIYADPAWSYKQQGKTARGIANNHYQTMSVEDICKLPVRDITTDDAICFLWATFPNIAEALQVMSAWGFEYKTAAFVWVKQNKKTPSLFWGMGAYTRANAEVCLLGISARTKARQQVLDNGVHQIIESPIEEHSRKPDETRKRIERLLGDVPRIELFARGPAAHGWDAWGNEVDQEEAAADE